MEKFEIPKKKTTELMKQKILEEQKTTETKRRSVSFVCDLTDYEMLEKIAEQEVLSISQLLRKIIKRSEIIKEYKDNNNATS